MGVAGKRGVVLEFANSGCFKLNQRCLPLCLIHSLPKTSRGAGRFFHFTHEEAKLLKGVVRINGQDPDWEPRGRFLALVCNSQLYDRGLEQVSQPLGTSVSQYVT